MALRQEDEEKLLNLQNEKFPLFFLGVRMWQEFFCRQLKSLHVVLKPKVFDMLSESLKSVVS
jgi:hypothetical protein